MLRQAILATLTVAGAFISSPAVRSADGADGVTVAPRNLKLLGGHLRCLAFSSAQGFPDSLKQAVAAVSVPVTSRDTGCHFPELPAGSWAFAFFHDANGDGVLNTNFLGIPTEGYGFSNDASGTFGPPSFEEVVVVFDGALRTLAPKVRY